MNRRFTLLSESLLLGVLVFVASLPLVTMFAAGDRRGAGYWARPRRPRSASVRTPACWPWRGRGPFPFVVPSVAVLVLLLDWTAVRAGLPGGEVLAVVIPVPALAAAALALRAAALWRPDLGWTAVCRSAAGADLYGTALLAMAVVVATVVCSTFPIVTPLAFGQMILAAVAVDARVAARA